MAPAWQQEELSRKTTMMHSRTAEQSIWPSVVKEKTSPIDRKMTPAENKNHEQKSVAFINPVDPRTGYQCKWEDIKNLYAEGVSHSEKAEVTLKKIGSELHVRPFQTSV